VLLTLGVIGIIWGAICATMQKDLKHLVAYSSVAHLGFIVLGTFSLTKEGIEGAGRMVNHGITTPALFLLVGMIYERRHPQHRQARRSAGVGADPRRVLHAGNAGIGRPARTQRFPGEFLALAGAFKGARWWAVVAASGVILAALYLLWAYQRVFHGAAEGDNATMRDLRLVEGLVLAPLCALIIVLGVYPKVMLDRIEPSVTALVEHMQRRRRWSLMFATLLQATEAGDKLVTPEVPLVAPGAAADSRGRRHRRRDRRSLRGRLRRSVVPSAPPWSQVRRRVDHPAVASGLEPGPGRSRPSAGHRVDRFSLFVTALLASP
jgi:formate hydrogenlyase subunit 3/multisubunit Na+/H+ antiporter MnhD subunit